MASQEEKEAAITAFIDAASALVGEIFGGIRTEGKAMAELMASGGAVSVPPSPLVALDNGEMVLTRKTVEKIRGDSQKFVDDECSAEGGSSPPDQIENPRP